MDRGAWWAAVHGVATSQTRLSNFPFTFHFHALEEEMATHSRILAWRIPGTGEPGGLPSLGLHRVGHDWSNLAAAAACSQSFYLAFHLNHTVWHCFKWPHFNFYWEEGNCKEYGYHELIFPLGYLRYFLTLRLWLLSDCHSARTCLTA